MTRSEKGCKHFYKTLIKSTLLNNKIWSGHKDNWEPKVGTINQDDWDSAIKNYAAPKDDGKRNIQLFVVLEVWMQIREEIPAV